MQYFKSADNYYDVPYEISVLGPELEQQEWLLLGASFNHAHGGTTIKFWVNGEQVTNTHMTSVFWDSLNFAHVFGSEYVGFIYSFGLYNYATDVFVVDQCPGCDACPLDTCLSS